MDALISRITKISFQIGNLSWYLQCLAKTYFHTAESVWAPKKMSPNFQKLHQFFLTLISLITVHSSYLIIL